MRKGVNPAKLEDNKVENESFHQVIVPIYLPNLEGYYKEGLEILKLCLESIYLTVHDKTYVSVVNNGSCEEVKVFLDELLKLDKIQEVIHTSAIGKINAIAKGLAGHNFDLVTITDADVLFTNGWQKAVYEIYEAFPKAGAVGTTPNPLAINRYTENIFFDNFFNQNFKFYSLKEKTGNDIDFFFKSIGWKGVKSNLHTLKSFALSIKGIKATIGTGHFSATYKSCLLNKFYNRNVVLDKISSDSDKDYLDLPSIKKGHWRLATFENFTYHMGNHIENWMYTVLENTTNEKDSLNVKLANDIGFNYYYLNKFVNKFFFKTTLFKKYLSSKGLSQKEVEEFLL